jgi:hypothetical protein
MVPTTAQKTSKCTLHVSFFRPVRRVPTNVHSSHPILGSSTSCMCGVVVVETCSTEHLFMVKLYPSRQSQSRHDWPRPLPRARSSARYANRAPFSSPFRSNRVARFIFLTHTNPSLAQQVYAFRSLTVSKRHHP